MNSGIMNNPNTPNPNPQMSSPPPKPNRIVAISLKLYFTHAQTIHYTHLLTHLASHALSHNITLLLLPSLLSLSSTRSLLPPSILLGAQDCSPQETGAYTGAVSPAVLAELGCRVVELGHAERYRYFSETDEMVVEKAQAVERNGMVPMVCIGERERGTVDEAIASCRLLVERVLGATQGEVWFAYEPVWAIGGREPAEGGYVRGVVGGLRKGCGERRTRWLYGGSAGVGTFRGLRGGEEGEGIDGLFLGRFGHDVERVREIITEVGEA